jgi:Calcium-activated chloride channel
MLKFFRKNITKFWKESFLQTLFSPLSSKTNLQSFRPITQLAFYHSIQIGYLFKFLITYTSWILPLGIILLILQVASYLKWEKINSPLTFVVPIITGLWSSIFFLNWKRREKELSHIFGVDLTKDERENINLGERRPGYKGDYIIDDVTQNIVKKDWVSAHKRQFMVLLIFIQNL